MNLKQLNHFKLVAEELNYHQAAKRANLSQPAMSHSIKSLENQLDAKLFDRSSRTVRLTPFGTSVLELANKLLFEAKNFDIGVKNLQMGVSGQLSIGLATTVAENLGGRALALFSSHYPRINFEVSVYNSAHILDLLSQERLHAAICDLQTATLRGDIDEKFWTEQPGGFFCRPEHPILSHPSPTFKLAHSYGFASLNVTPSISRKLERQLGIDGQSEPLIKIASDNLKMCRDICTATNFILIGELDNMRSDVAAGTLVPLSLEFSFQRNLCIATKIGRSLPQSAMTLISFLKQHGEVIAADDTLQIYKAQ